MKRLGGSLSIGVVILFALTACSPQAPALKTAEPPSSSTANAAEDLAILADGFVSGGYTDRRYWFEVENTSKTTAYAVNFEFDVYGEGDAIYSLDNSIWGVKILPQQKLKLLGSYMSDPGTGVVPVRADLELNARSRPARNTEKGILEATEVNLNFGEYDEVTIDGRVVNNSDVVIDRWEAIAWCADGSGNLVFAESYPAYDEPIDVGAEKPFQIRTYKPEGVQIASCTATAVNFIN